MLQFAKQSANRSMSLCNVSSPRLAEVARGRKILAKLLGVGGSCHQVATFFSKFPTHTEISAPGRIALISSKSSLFRERIDHSAIDLSRFTFPFPFPWTFLPMPLSHAFFSCPPASHPTAWALNIFIIKLSSENQITTKVPRLCTAV